VCVFVCVCCFDSTWLQIRVVNAFRMGLDGADSFEKRSLSSVHSHLSLYALRNAVALAAAAASEQKRATDDPGSPLPPASPGDDSAFRV